MAFIKYDRFQGYIVLKQCDDYKDYEVLDFGIDEKKTCLCQVRSIHFLSTFLTMIVLLVLALIKKWR